jgi:hypothetical protein
LAKFENLKSKLKYRLMDQFNNHPLFRKHNIDSAMNSLWEFYKQRFMTLFLLSFAMSLVTQYASTFVNIKEIQSVTDPLIMLEKMKAFLVPILIVSLINLLFTTILQYYIIYNPVDSENNIFRSVTRSLKYFIPYLIVMIILAFAGAIAVVAGLFVLIIGAFFSILYVFTLYLFVLPVMMAEGINIGNTIARTFKLAHRNFWSNIGWVAVFLILIIVISFIFSAIILLPFSGGFLKAVLNPDAAENLVDITTKPLFIILSAAVNALVLPVVPIFASILYFNGIADEGHRQEVTQPESVKDIVKVEDLYAKPYSDDHPDNPEKKV